MKMIHWRIFLDKSKYIIEKMKSDNKRFFACDNVSEYLTPTDIQDLIDEVTEKFQSVLGSLLIDVDNDPNSKDTARRLAKMYYNEIMSGRFYPEPPATSFPNEGSETYQGMLVVRAELKSICSHHHQPVVGTAYIGILPNKNVIGLSKYIRIAQHQARRGTLQESLCVSINEAIKKATDCQDVAVYIEADHGCCVNRGIMAKSALTQTTVLSGRFYEKSLKQEFFDNIKLQKKGN